MRLLRSTILRNALWLHFGGRCAICGDPLPPKGWHADHILPWSKGGKTNVHEMQALCPGCNLKKGNRMAGDRKHQADLRKQIAQRGSESFPLSVLAYVVPAGGKSRLPGIIAAHFREHKIAWFVPRISLQSQAIESMSKDFGISLRDAGNDVDPCRGHRGFVATHTALTFQPDLWRQELESKRGRYIVIVDECHHAKVDRNGDPSPLGKALSQLRADIWLNMTGTLETSDNTQIYGMNYRDHMDGLKVCPEDSAKLYIRYERVTALEEKAIVPIEFFHHDGPVNWQRIGELSSRGGQLSEIAREDEGAGVWTALRTDYADQLFEGGLNHWRKHKGRNGKLIVVAHNQAAAGKYAERLSSQGIGVALAIDDNPKAHDEVRRFRTSPDTQALATCQMAYEGLDAPPASHLICLTHIRSVPWIEQMLARIWRAAPAKKKCWAFVPDDPRMNRVIERIQQESPAPITIADYEGSLGSGSGSESKGAETILALDGSVEDIRAQLLDAGFAPDEITDEIIQFVQAHGLIGDEPEVLALLRKIKAVQIPQTPMATPKEKEERLRKQIKDLGSKIDAECAERNGAKPEFGTTMKKLIRVTGKSITEMNEGELRRAFTRLADFRPR